MREILFRAKTSDEVRGFNSAPNGTWVYGFYVDKVGLPVIYQFEQSRADYVEYEVDRETVGQFTGLTDKNGKQIFEGDIVKINGWWNAAGWAGYTENLTVVEFNESLCGFTPMCIYDCDCGVYHEARDTEVIGNIYDNPELLVGAK